MARISLVFYIGEWGASKLYMFLKGAMTEQSLRNTALFISPLVCTERVTFFMTELYEVLFRSIPVSEPEETEPEESGSLRRVKG